MSSQKSRMHFIKKYFLSIIVTIVIFYLSTASPSALPLPEMPKIEGFDKIVHMLMYAVLALVLVLETTRRNNLGYYSLVILFPILYGGLLEILQHYFFPPRTGDWFDFLANTIGVLIGFAMATVLLNGAKARKARRHEIKKH